MIQPGICRFAVIASALCFPGATQSVLAQGYGSPLTMQGVNHATIASASSRGAGGISVGMKGDITLMFVNPAALQGLEGIHLSVGGMNQSRTLDQAQQWYPLRSFPTFSLMMEGLIDQIKNPDLSDPPPEGLGPEDYIARPYDTIKPNWSREEQKSPWIQGFVGVPLTILGLDLAAGLGAVEYANLDYYFQNNNVLSPSIGTQRPFGIPLPAIGQEVVVQWSQYVQQREGSIHGYGGAVSAAISKELSVGLSGLFLNGRSDDLETAVSRGDIRFGNNSGVYYQALDSVYERRYQVGTSDYSGEEFTISSLYQGRYVTLGLMVKPPSRVLRKFAATVQQDTGGAPVTSTLRGEDKILLPWRGTVGIAVDVRDDLMLGLEYEIRPFESTEYTDASGKTTRPWLSSSLFRFGAQYLPQPWLAIRAGIREESEVFEPEGNALIGEAVRYSIYSFGLGFTFAGIHLNAAYEYSLMKYQDMWQTNVNLNNENRHTLIADVSYVIQ
jgi:hypothetical protein